MPVLLTAYGIPLKGLKVCCDYIAHVLSTSVSYALLFPMHHVWEGAIWLRLRVLEAPASFSKSLDQGLEPTLA